MSCTRVFIVALLACLLLPASAALAWDSQKPAADGRVRLIPEATAPLPGCFRAASRYLSYATWTSPRLSALRPTR